MAIALITLITLGAAAAVDLEAAATSELDTNAEINLMYRDLLIWHDKADLDGDGEVSSADLAAHHEKVMGATEKQRADLNRQRALEADFFAAADKDGDGQISRDEHIAATLADPASRGEVHEHARLERAGHVDLDGAGHGEGLNGESLDDQPRHPLSESERSRIEEMANGAWEEEVGAAALSKERAIELAMGFVPTAEKLVAAADTNGDGKISRSEMEKVNLADVPSDLIEDMHNTADEL